MLLVCRRFFRYTPNPFSELKTPQQQPDFGGNLDFRSVPQYHSSHHSCCHAHLGQRGSSRRVQPLCLLQRRRTRCSDQPLTGISRPHKKRRLEGLIKHYTHTETAVRWTRREGHLCAHARITPPSQTVIRSSTLPAWAIGCESPATLIVPIKPQRSVTGVNAMSPGSLDSQSGTAALKPSTATTEMQAVVVPGVMDAMTVVEAAAATRQHAAHSRPTGQAVSYSSMTSTRGKGRGLRVLAAAVNHGYDGLGWYVSTREVENVCLELCVTCRNLPMSCVLVTRGTPHRLWVRRKKSKGQKKRRASRVPALAVRSLKWDYPPDCISRGSRTFFVDDGAMAPTPIRVPRAGWTWTLSKTWWPTSLRKMSFGHQFNHRVDRIIWPATLQFLTFGCRFNRSIECVVWPASLEHLTFGKRFNQHVHPVEWPVSLTHLSFGSEFTRAIHALRWPESLKSLKLGCKFNRRLAEVRWPASLQHIKLGFYFNRAVEDVRWPPSLERLTFGAVFNQPIEEVVWPRSLKYLTFGSRFNQPIGRCRWPASLEHVSFDDSFHERIRGGASSASQRLLAFGAQFNHPIEDFAWKTSPEAIKFGTNFNQPIDTVVWPNSLISLTFGAKFNQPIDWIVWPASLQRLTFGASFNQPIDMVLWPASLTHLTFGMHFHQPIDRADWPTSLQSLKCGHGPVKPVHRTSLGPLPFEVRLNQPVGVVSFPASM